MANENRSERRGDSIPSRIVVPVVVGIILALMVGGTSPWWWNALFPGPSGAPVTPLPTQASSAPVTPSPTQASSAPVTPPPTQASSAPVTPPPTEASFLDLLQGEWTLDTWQERPGDITLYMHPLRGSLFVDVFGHAYWDLDIDDGGPTPAITPRMRAVGMVDVSTESLAHWTGHLTVDGNDVIDTEYDWTGNLLSLRGDVWLAYGGAAPPGSQLFVYDTDISDYTLTITLAADAAKTRLLTMRNAAGTFTWKGA